MISFFILLIYEHTKWRYKPIIYTSLQSIIASVWRIHSYSIFNTFNYEPFFYWALCESLQAGKNGWMVRQYHVDFFLTCFLQNFRRQVICEQNIFNDVWMAWFHQKSYIVPGFCQGSGSECFQFAGDCFQIHWIRFLDVSVLLQKSCWIITPCTYSLINSKSMNPRQKYIWCPTMTKKGENLRTFANWPPWHSDLYKLHQWPWLVYFEDFDQSNKVIHTKRGYLKMAASMYVFTRTMAKVSRMQ